MQQTVRLNDIEAAAARIKGTARRTPLLGLEPGLYAKAGKPAADRLF